MRKQYHLKPCPRCGTDMVRQPTTGTQYYQWRCHEKYLTKEGHRSEKIYCGYWGIEKEGRIISEAEVKFMRPEEAQR